MVDPVTLVATILGVVKLIASVALTARQNKKKCLQLARRAENLGAYLQSFAIASAAGNNMATVQGLERLRDALNEAVRVIRSCQEGRRSGIFSCVCSSPKDAELDNVNLQISNCLSDLGFFNVNLAGAAHHVAPAAASVPAQSYAYGFPPTLQPTVNVQYNPGPAPYNASPAPSGFNLSSLYTLPTVNRVFDRIIGR